MYYQHFFCLNVFKINIREMLETIFLTRLNQLLDQPLFIFIFLKKKKGKWLIETITSAL
jgi:hypothetical protein